MHDTEERQPAEQPVSRPDLDDLIFPEAQQVFSQR